MILLGGGPERTGQITPHQRVNLGIVPTESAAWLAESLGLDISAQIEGHEKDAKVALAGPAAQRRSHPHTVLDVIVEDADGGDIPNARNACSRAVCLKAGVPLPDGSANVAFDLAIVKVADAMYARVCRETDALVAEHWPAIKRVARALERHDRLDKAEVDDLIERVERNAKRKA